MGGQAQRHFTRFRRKSRVPADPPSMQGWHYAFRGKTALRKAENHRQFKAIRAVATVH
jgi:hypothetical protein